MNYFRIITILFFIYSFFGWIFEVCWEFIQNHRLVNRGFLIGPYCPIYGIAIIVMLNIFPYLGNHPLGYFFITMFICAIFEYTTSYALEKLFHTRWWDYSNFRFHVNGRICLEALTLFGVSNICIAYFINPVLLRFLLKIPTNILFVIHLFLLFFFVVDCLLSFIILKKIPKQTVGNTDVTDVISKQVSQKIKSSLRQITK